MTTPAAAPGLDRALTVLSVGYPLAPVSPDSAGGAEQILATLDRALIEAGHRSIVVAPRGSLVSGTLLPIDRPAGCYDDDARRRAQHETADVVAAALAREAPDIVHCHGIDFAAYLPPPGVPVLATLHLPPDWYGEEALHPVRPDTWVHCVSETQHAACSSNPRLLPPIANGIAVEAYRLDLTRRRFALWLGRICPEKGPHIAIAAARRAGIGLVIAGEVYPYADHQRYFDTMIRPQLGPGCRFAGPVGFLRKRRLMSAARCVLVPSLAAETSSLVAREAAACGTPVIAFPNGALAETVEHGRTGLLVDDEAEMAAAIPASMQLSPETCRDAALARFSDRSMIAAYLALYGRLARRTAAG